VRRTVAVCSAAAVLLVNSTHADGSMGFPVPFWERIHRSSAILLADVETIELVTPGADWHIVLRVRERWKGTSDETVSWYLHREDLRREDLRLTYMLLDRALKSLTHGPGPSPPVGKPETLVVFVEPRDRPMDVPVNVSIGIRLRPLTGDIGAMRGLLTKAVAIQRRPPEKPDARSEPTASLDVEYREWRARALGSRALRAVLIREEERARSSEWNHEDQKILAEGFVREPSLDEGLATTLRILRGYKSAALDEVALGCVDNMLTAETRFPGTTGLAAALVLERYGASETIWSDLATVRFDIPADEIRALWERAARTARLPAVSSSVRDLVAQVREQTPPDR
jgi:hypothetical protein